MEKALLTKVFAKEYSPKEIKRRAFIWLAAEQNTPIDIFTSQFGEITESQTDYVMVQADVNLSFRCTVGYDREEKYYDKTAQMEKTRTVTDWEPFSGTNQSHEMVCVQNTDDGYKVFATSSNLKVTENFIVEKAINEYNLNNLKIADKEININNNAINYAKERCEDASYSNVRLPGDHHKDESHSAIVNVTDMVGLIVPESSMNYKYHEKDYTYKDLAFGKTINNMGTMPSDKYTIELDAKRKALKFLIIGIVLLVVAATCLVVAMIAEIPGWICVPAIFCIIGGIVLICFYPKFKSKYAWNMRTNMKEVKMQELNYLLKKQGEPELTEDEKKLIQSYSTVY